MPENLFKSDRTRFKQVNSFHELLATPFANGINALCWQRTLPGDFAEIVRHVPNTGEDIASLDDTWLAALSATVTPAGRAAIDILLEDQRQLREHGLSPTLDCIFSYTRDDQSPIPTHVQSFHIDTATVEADTWLCTYHGPSSEGLPNEQALRRVDIPETRARLLELFGGEDNAAFREYLGENCYDLHYLPAPGAQPYIFGISNLWRIATRYPGSPVPPCIHRAPETSPGDPPRLLLIA
ncbi:MAG TPA: hypothetical protein VG733_19660 [Chthoniobacteraceae bacterium]|nr:hypothetical protein [Chthoniobacteraceae bacterium]